jgi:hypothetical protein
MTEHAVLFSGMCLGFSVGNSIFTKILLSFVFGFGMAGTLVMVWETISPERSEDQDTLQEYGGNEIINGV